MKVIVTGGGTGGHIYPALAIAESVLKEIPNSEVLYIGCEDGLENQIVPGTNIAFKTISAKGLPRKLSPALFKAAFISSKGVLEANQYIKEFQPDLVIGTGGFVCGPTVLMAAKNHIPTMIHEQNAYPGITNKILAPMVSKVLVCYPEAKGYFKRAKEIVQTGLPVRSDIAVISREEGCEKFDLDPSLKTILITGGSRGARTINRVCALALPGILSNPNVQVIFIAGKTGYVETSLLLKDAALPEEFESRLHLLDYTHHMPHALAAADVVIGRAGATFLAEIAVRGVPGILVPYPYASENHQEHNARAVIDAGGAEMILDDDFTVPKLMAILDKFLNDQAYYMDKKTHMQALARPEALTDIMTLVKEFNK